MDRRRELEEGEARALPVAVDQDDLTGLGAAIGGGLGALAGQDDHGARAPADQRVLTAVAVAGVVGVRPVGHRHAAVVLADAGPHLGDERLPQWLGPVEGGPGERVLRVEMGPDIGGQGGGVLENLAPVLGLQPGIIVDDLLAVDLVAMRAGLRDRRRLRDGKGDTVGSHRDVPRNHGAAGRPRPRQGCAARAPGGQGRRAAAGATTSWTQNSCTTEAAPDARRRCAQLKHREASQAGSVRHFEITMN